MANNCNECTGTLLLDVAHREATGLLREHGIREHTKLATTIREAIDVVLENIVEDFNIAKLHILK